MDSDADKDSNRSGGLRGRFQAARGVAGRSIDRVTGSEFRDQFEEFTGAVTRTAVGLHRDQAKLEKRIEELEQDRSVQNEPLPAEKSGSANWVAISLAAAALVVAIIALVLAI